MCTLGSKSRLPPLGPGDERGRVGKERPRAFRVSQHRRQSPEEEREVDLLGMQQCQQVREQLVILGNLLAFEEAELGAHAAAPELAIAVCERLEQVGRGGMGSLGYSVE